MDDPVEPSADQKSSERQPAAGTTLKGRGAAFLGFERQPGLGRLGASWAVQKSSERQPAAGTTLKGRGAAFLGFERQPGLGCLGASGAVLDKPEEL